ncbi:hypothetical protein [Nocardia africana]|uniref:hypothetical protein n=1 Tax=Nocardia africana TaxID=134964 RepID=UPI0007A5454B|nr:hypothetical protein [Nocardia africana]MCC3318452.1 hypothetical protein [Nocardia africana]
MADKKHGAGAVGARKLARERMAAALEARRRREEQNTKDLEEFYVLGSKIDAAAAKRDAAIAAAHKAYTEAEASALDEQGAALRRIRDRNTPQAELLEMTGLGTGELQRLLRRAAPSPATTSSSSAARTTPAAAADESTVPASVTPIGARGDGKAQHDESAKSAPAPGSGEDRQTLGTPAAAAAAAAPGSAS